MSANNDLMQMGLPELTLSPEDIHASHSAMQGRGKATKMNDTCGLKCCDLYENCTRNTSLQRMLLGMFPLASMKLRGAWSQVITPGGRLVFQLSLSVPAIKESVYGLSEKETLQRIEQRMGGNASTVVKMFLEDAGAIMESDSVSSAGNGPTRSITRWKTAALTAERTGLYPTPTANEDACGKPGSNMQIMLGNHPSIRNSTRQVLNPDWVELLMGFPEGWTDLKDSETP